MTNATKGRIRSLLRLYNSEAEDSELNELTKRICTVVDTAVAEALLQYNHFGKILEAVGLEIRSKE